MSDSFVLSRVRLLTLILTLLRRSLGKILFWHLVVELIMIGRHPWGARQCQLVRRSPAKIRTELKVNAP